MTAPQRMVVRIVGRFPGISAGQLSEILHTHPSTVTGLLKRLAQKGLITRRPDPRDGRRLRLGLTASGRKIDVQTAGSVEAAIVSSFEQLDPRDDSERARGDDLDHPAPQPGLRQGALMATDPHAANPTG